VVEANDDLKGSALRNIAERVYGPITLKVIRFVKYLTFMKLWDVAPLVN
jgi:hypothetical protein